MNDFLHIALSKSAMNVCLGLLHRRTCYLWASWWTGLPAPSAGGHVSHAGVLPFRRSSLVPAHTCSDGLSSVCFPRVRGSKQMNTLQCARHVYQTEGVRGFYRGLTASYAGISETVICFAIYESLKKCLKDAPLAPSTKGAEKNSTNFFGLMAAAAVAKGCASCIAYPHGMCCLPPQETAVRRCGLSSESESLEPTAVQTPAGSDRADSTGLCPVRTGTLAVVRVAATRCHSAPADVPKTC